MKRQGDIKQCSECKERKSVADFYKNPSLPDRLDNLCKECRKVRVKLYDKKKVWKKKKYILEYLKNHACVDCDNDDIRVLDFDHVRGEKKNHVSTMVRDRTSVSVLISEIEKCDIRCANCHRIRTGIQTLAWKNDPSSSLGL